MMLEILEGSQEPDSAGAVTLEAFNTGFEWRNRDDTYGPFIKAHTK
jgi:hypothetical protein